MMRKKHQTQTAVDTKTRICKWSNGLWGWVLYTPEGKLLAVCPIKGYETRADAISAIRSIVPRTVVFDS